MDIIDLPAHALAGAIRARQVSCRDVMRATLERIAAVNPLHNAIVSLRDGEALLSEAEERDRQLGRGATPAGPIGPMHGMPQAIKDMAQTAGLRTTLGSPLLRDFVPTEDGLMVQRMKAAGCIVIGKTNTSEFGLGSHTFNEVFGVTRNAYDASRSAGGSSGGAAVALALRMLAVADGSDFMGSLRNPAAWNNVFGFRPSRGRVPAWPVPDVSSSRSASAGVPRAAGLVLRGPRALGAGWRVPRAARHAARTGQGHGAGLGRRPSPDIARPAGAGGGQLGPVALPGA